MAHKQAARIVVALGLLCTACAGRVTREGAVAAPQPTASASVEARAAAYWKRREAKDLAGAYPFYCSGYRARVPRDEFLQLTRLTRFDLQDTRVTRVEGSGDRRQVTVTYRFLLPRISPEPLAGEVTESWARDADGQWCKEDEPAAMPFPKLSAFATRIAAF